MYQDKYIKTNNSKPTPKMQQNIQQAINIMLHCVRTFFFGIQFFSNSLVNLEVINTIRIIVSFIISTKENKEHICAQFHARRVRQKNSLAKQNHLPTLYKGFGMRN